MRSDGMRSDGMRDPYATRATATHSIGVNGSSCERDKNLEMFAFWYDDYLRCFAKHRNGN